MPIDDSLDLFLPAVRTWFRESLGEPTPAQRLSWPGIVAGQHTLILAPTGSGKTLAAFLACLDLLWRQDPPPPGVKVLYVSPLKALNNDIHRNLQVPLEGVAEAARKMGLPLPTLTAGVRTGDTSTAERQRQARKPPQILITTPESLHLLLTSRARETLRQVTHCIIDEIHAVCTNKRGVFLALLLERLEAITPRSFVRIGLSATQRPLEEVARYLGGSQPDAEGNPRPRPVTIVDAGLRKNLDLLVVNPVDQFGPLPEKTIWPSIYWLLSDQVRAHRSTIIFANNRRAVERITANLNAEEEIARAHHGSVALEVRQATEKALKEGRLPAVVATASLELGIDMGAVDLVCQVESPGSIARGLQRVGRAGHLVGQTSKGRLIPKMASDLLEQAVLAHEMVAGRVEAIRVPTNCLDVLAQQLVALAAKDTWDITELYALVRRAYPYRDLSPQAFETVLEMISGRFGRGKGIGGGELGIGTEATPRSPHPTPYSPQALHPRVSWDRVHNRLLALPGSQQLALVNGGTIPDTGQYAAYTSTGVRIGELDEEFIYERRVGDSFLLGTNAWHLDKIDSDRVIVSPAEGAPAMVPFWRGENTGRSLDLSVAMGRFLRELAGRIDDSDCLPWLERDYHLDAKAASSLRGYVRRQLAVTDHLPTDQTVTIEASRDQLGDWQVLLLSLFGSRLHLALRLALEGRLRQRLGYRPQCLHHNDGLLIRLTDTDEPVLDLFDGLTSDNVEAFILEELSDSALFALRFRQNAARSLLFPRLKAGQRSPLWLQRLRGRDLLQVARQHPDFPVVVETFRECLHDHLDVPRLKSFLADVQAGRVQVVTRRAEAPSPFAANLLFNFTASYMYQYDGTEGEGASSASLNADLLDQLVSPESHGHLLDPRAVHQVDRRLRGLGLPPRTVTEMAEWLRRLGDLTASDLEGPMAGFLTELEADGRATRLDLPRCEAPFRWVLTEEASVYATAFGLDSANQESAQAAGEIILGRFLETHALVGLNDVLSRYPFEPAWAKRKLEEWAGMGRLVEVRPKGSAPTVQWSAPANLDQMQRGSLSLMRQEVMTCSPPQFADFLLRWQMAHPATRTDSAEGLLEVLQRLQGLALPAELWERVILSTRVLGYQPRWLDDALVGGAWTWLCQGETPPGPGMLAFLARGQQRQLTVPAVPDQPELDAPAEQILDYLRRSGASFVADLAQDLGLAPSSVRAGLWKLLRRSLIANDHFDLIRKGETVESGEHPNRGGGRGRGNVRQGRGSDRPRLRSQRASLHPEGRWSVIPWGLPETEPLAVRQASLLLNRYGIVARELALLDPWLLPWRVLYEVLSRLELTGEVRRGYFVEGLSGAQFALPEAAKLLQEVHVPSTATAPVVLLHSLDPANLYGAGAPFDVPLLDGGTRPLLRRAGNWLTLRAGKPIVLIEGQGKRLTALASASRADIAVAVACLPSILEHDASLASRHKLVVEEWNGQPVTGSEGRKLLEAAGFVRDYQGMTLYVAWK